MFPEGIKQYIIWQCLQDRVAPVVYTVDIYIYVCIFVCVRGSPAGLILSDVLFPSPSEQLLGELLS